MTTVQHDYEIPPEVERQFEGQWIAWDVEQQDVAGHGATLEEALAMSRPAHEAGRLLWYHHILPAHAVIAGGL